MIRDEHLFDKIEAYLRGKMPPSDAAAFEADMAANPELAAEVQQHRIERQGQEWLVERDLLSKMNTWERDLAPQAPMRVTFVRRWWAVGVAATLILGVFGWWLLQPQTDIGGPPPIANAPQPAPQVKSPSKKTPRPAQRPPGSGTGTDSRDLTETATPQPAKPTPDNQQPAVDFEALADTYYREADFMQQQSGSPADPSGYGEALDSYKSGKYSDVEKLLSRSKKNDLNVLKNKELLAHSLYQRGRYAEATSYFRQLAGAKDKILAERAEWALALTLLHRMPAEKTALSSILNRIGSKQGHAFYDKAVELKKRLQL